MCHSQQFYSRHLRPMGGRAHTLPALSSLHDFCLLLLIRVGAGRRSRAGKRNAAASQESWSGYFEVEDEDLMFLDYLGVLLCYVFLVVNSDVEKTEQAISNFPSEWGMIRLFKAITYNNNALHFQLVTVCKV